MTEGDAAGTNKSTNVRQTRHKSSLCQWFAVSLWFPRDKDSLPTDSVQFALTETRSSILNTTEGQHEDIRDAVHG